MDELFKIEELAVELARLAGAEIENALGTTLAIRYKEEEGGDPLWHDPVSEVDHRVEQLIRLRLAERFPAHGIIGEEMGQYSGSSEAFIWVVDPIDGTANFINGFPLFAASIGVLKEGRPVAGAVWCSSSHALRAGVYHAHIGGSLRFDEQEVAAVDRTAVRRSLISEPDPEGGELPWDVRKTGSTAIECAFVGVGLLRAARFASPDLWDVAGGLPLVLATGGMVVEQVGDEWRSFEGFGTDCSDWRRPLILGEAKAVTALIEARGRGAITSCGNEL